MTRLCRFTATNSLRAAIVVAMTLLSASTCLSADDSLPPAAICRLGEANDTNWSHGIYAVTFSPDGKLAATRSSDQVIRIWNIRDGIQARALPEYQEGRIKDFTFSRDSQYLVTAVDSDKPVPNIWSLADGKPIRAERLPATFLVRATKDPGVFAFVSRTGVTRRSLEKPNQPIDDWGLPNAGERAEPAAVSPDGREVLLRTIPELRSILLIVPLAGTQPTVLDGFDKGITHARWSPNGLDIAVTCRDDRRVFFRDATRPSIKISSGGHTAAVQDVAFSADARHLVSVDVDGKVRIWEMMTKQCVAEIDEGSARRLVSVTFSPDGRYLATGSAGKEDNSAIVWDWKKLLLASIQTGKPTADSWEGLATQDPQVAYPCIERMVRSPSTIALLTKKLGALNNTLSREQIDELIQQLNSSSYALRTAAHEELARVRVTAAERLREVLDSGTAPVETEVRLRKLLSDANAKAGYDKGETRQLLRAVLVLELIGSSDAQKILQSVAASHPFDRVRSEAQAAIERFQPSGAH